VHLSILNTAVEPPGDAVVVILQHKSCKSLAVSADPFFPLKVPILVAVLENVGVIVWPVV